MGRFKAGQTDRRRPSEDAGLTIEPVTREDARRGRLGAWRAPGAASEYVCQACGAAFAALGGPVSLCGAWNTLVETRRRATARGASARQPGPSPAAPVAAPLREVAPRRRRAARRHPRGRPRAGRRAGAGRAGAPGRRAGHRQVHARARIAAGVARRAAAGDAGRRADRVLYASGEESAAQLHLRATAWALPAARPGSASTSSPRPPWTRIVAAAEALAAGAARRRLDPDADRRRARGPGRLGRPGPRGGRAAAAFAKRTACRCCLVGHVTKDGTLAGPRTLEHLVDVVLTLEGERYGVAATAARAEEPLRLDRGGRRLRDGRRRACSRSPIPARAFLGDGLTAAPGVAVAATLEGSRPLLVEVQALVAPAGIGSPRRTVAGLDGNRLALLIAVLGRRAGVNLASHDVYASVVGGLTVEEPAIDLPLALALASSLRDRPLRRHGRLRRDRCPASCGPSTASSGGCARRPASASTGASCPQRRAAAAEPRSATVGGLEVVAVARCARRSAGARGRSGTDG